MFLLSVFYVFMYCAVRHIAFLRTLKLSSQVKSFSFISTAFCVQYVNRAPCERTVHMKGIYLNGISTLQTITVSGLMELDLDIKVECHLPFVYRMSSTCFGDYLDMVSCGIQIPPLQTKVFVHFSLKSMGHSSSLYECSFSETSLCWMKTLKWKMRN